MGGERWVKTSSRITKTTGGETTHRDEQCWVNMAWVMSVHPSPLRKGGACLVFGISPSADEVMGYMDVPDPPEHFMPST